MQSKECGASPLSFMWTNCGLSLSCGKVSNFKNCNVAVNKRIVQIEIVAVASWFLLRQSFFGVHYGDKWLREMGG
jgi:hypothetical protein